MNLIETTNINEYKKAGGDPYSPENQRVCDQLVEREVICCVSSLVDHFARNPEALEGSGYSWEDDILPLCETVDYQEAAEDEDWEEDRCIIDDEDVTFINKKTNETSQAKDWEELCYEQDIEPYRSEVYEHWVVTDWLARKLRERGYVTGELFNLNIWGRQTTGQAILLDWVIVSIAAEGQLLVGQKYDWSKQR